MWCIREAKDRFLDHCRVGRSLSANTLKADAADFATLVGGEEAVGGVGRERLRGASCVLSNYCSSMSFNSSFPSLAASCNRAIRQSVRDWIRCLRALAKAVWALSNSIMLPTPIS